MAIFPGSAIPSAVSDYEIDNSVRFDDGSSPLLRRTPTATGDRQKMTWSAWVKKCYQNQSEYKKLIHIGSGSDELGLLWFDADEFWFYYYTGSYVAYLKTNAKYRDPSSWYHFVVSIDSTQATAADRIKIYVNGEQVTDFSTETYFAQNTNLPNVSGTAMDIGAYTASGIYFDGYFADFYFIDGTQLPASSFGELDSDTNMWKPLDSDDVKDAVNFGVNGFFQKYNSTELANSFVDVSEGGFKPSENITADVLIVAGGGGGGWAPHSSGGGGGGGGGFKYFSQKSLTADVALSVTVGAGGVGQKKGGDSSFGSDTATGGGAGDMTTAGGSYTGVLGVAARYNTSGHAGTANQGNDGGNGYGSQSSQFWRWGGGAMQPGAMEVVMRW